MSATVGLETVLEVVTVELVETVDEEPMVLPLPTALEILVAAATTVRLVLMVMPWAAFRMASGTAWGSSRLST